MVQSHQRHPRRRHRCGHTPAARGAGSSARQREREVHVDGDGDAAISIEGPSLCLHVFERRLIFQLLSSTFIRT